MRSLFRASLNGFVGNKPNISAAPAVLSFGVAPSCDVALVRIRNSEGQPIDRRPTFGREMENIFMAIVQVARRADRFEVTARSRQAVIVLDRDRLDPVNRVLKNE